MNNVKKQPKKLFVYNLALKRQDGKVEQDTVYRETLLTAQDVEKIGIDFSCSVLVSCVGTYRVADDNFIKDNTFIYELPKANGEFTDDVKSDVKKEAVACE